MNIDLMSDDRICMIKDDNFEYPSHEYNFSPSEHYPEYQYDIISPVPNYAYDKVRKLFHALKLDEEHYGLPEWNPLGDFIKPGNKVLIKPNFVMHRNDNEDGVLDSVVTHPSLIRAVLDYVLIATKGEGRIVVGDAPTAICDFDVLQNEHHYNAVWDFYEQRNIHIKPIDFRNSVIVDNKRIVQHDPSTGVLIDLGERSPFEELTPKQMDNFGMILGAYPNNIKNFHNKGTHKYVVNSYVIESDVIINMPKVKTHRKAGITVCSKNFVGTCALKDPLPHSIYGSIKDGGCDFLESNVFTKIYSKSVKTVFNNQDKYKYPKKYKYIRRLVYRTLVSLINKISPKNKIYSDGNWYANNVVWRFVVDLYNAIHFSDIIAKELEK